MGIKEINDYPFRYPYLEEDDFIGSINLNSLLGIKLISFDVAATTLSVAGST